MTAEVILTGTGIPAPVVATRAGPGVLVRVDDVLLQFDAGRGTTLRLAELDVHCTDLTAMFLTHHHSDHLIDLDDLVITRWFQTDPDRDPTLPIVAPEGSCVRFVNGLLDPWAEDIELRQKFSGVATSPTVELMSFRPSPEPETVWIGDGVSVSAVEVHHEPVVPAVAYRVNTEYGSIVISGDTVVCSELEKLVQGASVLVHEALCVSALEGEPYAYVDRYHANAIEIGAMAARCELPVVMLTHLIPPPMSHEEEQAFERDVRSGGFEGKVIVGRDLVSWKLSHVAR